MAKRKPGPSKGSSISASHKKKISNSVTGKKNQAYKDGRRSYRRIAGAKTNSGYVIHHKNGDRTDNRRSNLVKLKGKKAGTNTTTRHEKLTKRGQGRKIKSYSYYGTKKGMGKYKPKRKKK